MYFFSESADREDTQFERMERFHVARCDVINV